MTCRGNTRPPKDVWLFELAFFVIGVSVAIGMVTAIRDPGGFKATALDVARR
jgi:hypothetical protein